MKEFTKFEKARIKRTAQNVDQYVSKKKKLLAKVEELNKEIEELQQLIDLSDAPVKLMTGGYGVEDLIEKVVTPTDKLDKNGNVIKDVSYVFKHPDTIIPVALEDKVMTEEEAVEQAMKEIDPDVEFNDCKLAD